jgi:hypothetical protein
LAKMKSLLSGIASSFTDNVDVAGREHNLASRGCQRTAPSTCRRTIAIPFFCEFAHDGGDTGPRANSSGSLGAVRDSLAPCYAAAARS